MKILLIMPNFFNYPSMICEQLENDGHEVDFFDDRPSTNSFVKAAIRIKRDVLTHMISRYFNSIMDKIGKKRYDKVLVISGQSFSFTETMVQKLKSNQKQAEFVLYQWDAIRNFGYIEHLQKYFDRCYSFDRSDVAANSNLKFLPLFYADSYEKIGKMKPDEYKYDFMFVGTAHPKKYKYVKEMSEKLKPACSKQFIYFFFPSRLVYIYRKFKNPELKGAKYNDFHYTPISGDEMMKLLSESKCVLDSAQTGQLGLTIRVLETFGAKRKLITTNPDIVNYDFYCPENIYLYEDHFDFDSAFFKEPYKEIAQDVYEKYALRNWLKELIGD